MTQSWVVPLDRATSVGAEGDIGALSFRVLGPLLVAGRRYPARGRQATLLALLMLNANQVVAVDELIMQLFGDRTERPVRDLRVLVSRLRRNLEVHGLGANVVTVNNGYALMADAATVDVSVFDRLNHLAAGLERTDPGEALEMSLQALGLWRGEIPHDLGLDSYPGAVRMVELREAAIERRFRLELEFGQHDHCLPDLLASCRRNRYQERLWCYGIFGLYRAGRQADALALYQEARRYMLADLGLEPGPELKEAETLILTQSVPEPSLLGRRPISAPSRPRREDAVPEYQNQFVGSPIRVIQLSRLVVEHRLLTVTGTAGIGKTRLVVEAIPSLAELFPEGVVFCDLSTVDHDAAVAHAIAAEVAVRPPAGTDVVDALIHGLRRGRRLLVLDTCEHLLAGVGALAADLLHACPDLHLLATSRAPLHVEGEEIFPAAALDPITDGSELFIAEAIRTDGSFRLGEHDDKTVVTLCARLDGLPLAIQLAAARVRLMTPSEMLERLSLRFALFDLGPERHQGLRASIDWSYRLLTPSARTVLNRLGVFVGGVGLRAVESVCDPGDVGDGSLIAGLSELVDHSMVVPGRVGSHTHYRLLDSIRAFALGRLVESGEAGACFQRYAAFVARQKDACVARTRGPEAGAPVEEIDQLWPELRAAVTWAIDAGRADIASELLAGLGTEALFRERAEIGGWADLALHMPGALAQPRSHEMLVTAALADWAAGRFQTGYRRAMQALHLVRDANRPFTIDVGGALLLQIGACYPHRYLDACRAVGSRFARCGERYGQAWALSGQAMGYGYQGRAEEATAACALAEDLAARVGSPLLHALCRFALSIALVDTDPGRALQAAEDAVALATEVKATWILNAAPNYLAAALVRAGASERAVGYVLRTLDELLDGGSAQSTANTVRNTVALLDRLGAPERAARLLGWLGTNPPGVPGTPGMRQHAAEVATRLPSMVGGDRFRRLGAEGAAMTVSEIIGESRRALASLS